MSRSWWGRFCLLLFFIVLSVVYVFPTVSNLDLEKTKFPFKQKINLGLDLQGGLYMVLGVDFNRVFKDTVERKSSQLVARSGEKGIVLTNTKVITEGLPGDDPQISVDFDSAKRTALYDLVKKEFPDLRLVGEKAGQLELGLSHDFRTQVREKTLSQSIEVIRNRIDEFGVSEPSITSQGTDRVVVELPGVKELDRAKNLIGQTAKLEFKIVDAKGMSRTDLAKLIADIEKKNNFSFKEGGRFSDYVRKINDLAKGQIPAGDEISFERHKIAGTETESARTPYLLVSKAEVTGEDLQDAYAARDGETGSRPVTNFQLTPRGAVAFERLTGDHLHEPLAIVLDNVVQSAPIIQSKIPGGRGVITMNRENFESMEREARDLAVILRAGALPAQLDFLEQRVVGPSLGQDSIHKGALASLIGSVVVFVFVGIYYQMSGLIAVFSLILNVLFVLACLVGLDATLTLPGIAGIALTVGIAVDSNVVIYERIREEIRHGKRFAVAVDAGFQKAFRTILDANVTNAFAAIVLMTFGTGPIKGFAVTLMIGIVTTLFTAVFVCRLVFDLYLHLLENRKAKSISI